MTDLRKEHKDAAIGTHMKSPAQLKKARTILHGGQKEKKGDKLGLAHAMTKMVLHLSHAVQTTLFRESMFSFGIFMHLRYSLIHFVYRRCVVRVYDANIKN